jgi:signal transduction histidine kinase
VAGDDELGELTASYNAMIRGLRERESLREDKLRLVDDLRASRERLAATADAERRKVERDLHDGAQQSLVLLRLKLGMLDKRAQHSPELLELVHAARADLDRALKEIRDLAHGIYPAALQDGGLRSALEDLSQRSAIPVRIKCDGAGRYPPQVEAAVYFCCVEALQNAAKYAGEGATATVHLADADGQLEFAIEDDGHGYDPEQPRSPLGGVQNIIDRVGALGGAVAVRSAPGAGTTVMASIPVS